MIEQAKIREVPCIKCDANPGQWCSDDKGTALIACHPIREQLADKLPAIFNEDKLTATHKSLICFYMAVMICDSLSSPENSRKLFGKQLSSREIQVFFAKQAIRELIKDGLLIPEDKETQTVVKFVKQ